MGDEERKNVLMQALLKHKEATEKNLMEKFHEMDVDHDGYLSQQEIRDGFGILGFNEYYSSEFLAIFDTNKDSRISMSEYRTKLNLIPAHVHTDAAWRRMFQSYDTEHTGSVSLIQLRKIFKEQEESHDMKALKNWLQEHVDDDEIDNIDYEEFINTLKKRI